MTDQPATHDTSAGTLGDRERLALDRYLRPLANDSPEPVISCFVAALRDARYTTGRDLDTGVMVEPEQPALWLGALGYLAFLDQVGSAVRRDGWKRPLDMKCIEAALAQFAPHVTEPERQALYALRCAFAHDYGLMNPVDNQRKRTAYQHAFELRETGGPLVTFPDRRWKGHIADPGTPSPDPTVVNLSALGDTAEHVAADVLAAHAAGVLRTATEDPVELERRYLFVTG